MVDPLALASFDTPHAPRSYENVLVRPHRAVSPDERLKAAKAAGWNVFQFPADLLAVDLLSDSGTTALTDRQFAALVEGDESYGSNRGYFALRAQMAETFGIDWRDALLYLFHQGRAAEHALFSHITGTDLVIPANSFFDTTRANVEANRITALDLIDEKVQRVPNHPFKGNIDLDALAKVLKKEKGCVPIVYMTITNNTGGGQPVSLENLTAAKALAKKHGVSFFLDACRFAENAWFIKEREKGYAKKPIRDIVKKQFALADGFTISFKKDGLANMGGALCIRRNTPLLKRYPDLLDSLCDHQILVEGHPTYGGISGRDIMTIVEGLKTVVTEEYLKGRIGQTARFGEYLDTLRVPVMKPFGGHAIYIDVDRFFKGTKMKKEDFGGISLTALLLLRGIRLCELGAFAFGSYNPKTKAEAFPRHNFVRAAIPRNKYERDDLAYVADCIKGLHDRRHDLPCVTPLFGRDKTLRHFKARFNLR